MSTRAASPMPRRISPMLAVAGDLPPDDGWAFEVKWDGVRALSYVEGGELHMESRNLLDISPRYPELHALPAALGDRGAVLDGEVVAFDDDGLPSFGRLQHRMHVGDTHEVRRRMETTPVAYLVFDVLWLDGDDATRMPYEERRGLLDALDLTAASWQVPRWHDGGGGALLDAVEARGLEGVVAKRLGSTYEPGRRSTAWRKVKRQRRQEFVVGGWLPGAGSRAGRLGALLVGYHDGDGLQFAGRVGTGFTDKVLRELGERLDALATGTNPFSTRPPHKEARFVQPRLVVEVEFTEWTSGGTLRHPSFKGLRMDKHPTDVVRET